MSAIFENRSKLITSWIVMGLTSNLRALLDYLRFTDQLVFEIKRLVREQRMFLRIWGRFGKRDDVTWCAMMVCFRRMQDHSVEGTDSQVILKKLYYR
ncbi:unnamed protein product [Cochlearia groenlandica]